MFYALQNGQTPVYQTDEEGNILYYEDSEGNSYPLETGEMTVGYEKPVMFKANIAMSGGEAQAHEYGLSVSDFDAVIIADARVLPIELGARIWHTSVIGYKDTAETIPDESTADYSVVKVAQSINSTKYILKAIVK